MTMAEVKVGQVWEWRSRRRRFTKINTLRVVELVDFNHLGERCSSARCVFMETGAETVLEIARMKPSEFRGYWLMSEGDG